MWFSFGHSSASYAPQYSEEPISEARAPPAATHRAIVYTRTRTSATAGDSVGEHQPGIVHGRANLTLGGSRRDARPRHLRDDRRRLRDAVNGFARVGEQPDQAQRQRHRQRENPPLAHGLALPTGRPWRRARGHRGAPGPSWQATRPSRADRPARRAGSSRESPAARD